MFNPFAWFFNLFKKRSQTKSIRSSSSAGQSYSSNKVRVANQSTTAVRLRNAFNPKSRKSRKGSSGTRSKK